MRRGIGAGDPQHKMSSIKWILASVCLIVVLAEPEAPKGRWVMKDATLYLTPSQIKALEASKAEKGSSEKSNDEELKKLEAEIKKQLERQNVYINDPKEILIPDSGFLIRGPPPPVVEPNTERPVAYSPAYQQVWTPIPKIPVVQPAYFVPNSEGIQQNPIAKLPESYSFIKLFTDQKVHETPKLQLFHPIPHQPQYDFSKLFEVQRDPLHGKEYKLIPYQYLKDFSPGAPKLEEVKEISKLVAGLDKDAIPITEENKSGEEEKQILFNPYKDEPQLKYGSSYDASQHAPEYQKFLIKLEKENALARAEAILKSSTPSGQKTTPKPRLWEGIKNLNAFFNSGKSPSQIQHVWKH